MPEEQLWREMGYNAEQITEMVAMKAKAEAKRATLGSELLRNFDRGMSGEQGRREQVAAEESRQGQDVEDSENV